MSQMVDWVAAKRYMDMIASWLQPSLLAINNTAMKRDVGTDVIVQEINDRLEADMRRMFTSVFRDRILLVETYPNPGDGTALSEEEHDEAHEAWYQIREAKRLGYLEQVWPEPTDA